MTCTRPQAERQIPLATRASSTHDPQLSRHADAGLAALFENMDLQEEEARKDSAHAGTADRSDASIKDAAAALATAAASQSEIAAQLAAGEAMSDNAVLVSAGYRNCYALGRREMRAAFASPDDELFHEWRKAVQLHWRQSILLSTPWPALMCARAYAARELSQIIGQDHDLAVLALHAANRPRSVLSGKRRTAVLKTIERCQISLRAEARKIGAVLYAHKPAEIQRLVESDWVASCDRNGRLQVPHPALVGPSATN